MSTIAESEMLQSSSSGSTPSGGRQQRAPVSGADQYAELIQEFDKKMKLLRKVVDAGTAKQRALESRGDVFHEGPGLGIPFQPTASAGENDQQD